MSTKVILHFEVILVPKRRKLIQKEKENIVCKRNHIYSGSDPLTEAGLTIVILECTLYHLKAC